MARELGERLSPTAIVAWDSGHNTALNNTLGQIKWEQMLFLGNPEYECDLQPIDFVIVAEAVGMRGYRVVADDDCGRVFDAALLHDGPALVEATIDSNEPLLPPKRMPEYVKNLEKAWRAVPRAASRFRKH